MGSEAIRMSRPASSSLAFIVPTLSPSAAQDEDVVQLLLYAAARLAQASEASGKGGICATILSVEADTGGGTISPACSHPRFWSVSPLTSFPMRPSRV